MLIASAKKYKHLIFLSLRNYLTKLWFWKALETNHVNHSEYAYVCLIIEKDWQGAAFNARVRLHLSRRRPRKIKATQSADIRCA